MTYSYVLARLVTAFARSALPPRSACSGRGGASSIINPPGPSHSASPIAGPIPAPAGRSTIDRASAGAGTYARSELNCLTPSTRTTLPPFRRRCEARFKATVVFPAPPSAEKTAMTCACAPVGPDLRQVSDDQNARLLTVPLCDRAAALERIGGRGRPPTMKHTGTTVAPGGSVPPSQ